MLSVTCKLFVSIRIKFHIKILTKLYVKKSKEERYHSLTLLFMVLFINYNLKQNKTTTKLKTKK